MQMDFSPLVRAIVAELQGNAAPDEVLNTRGAATLLLLSENTVLQWAANGVIPGKKLDGRWRFRRSALLNHLSEVTQQEAEMA